MKDVNWPIKLTISWLREGYLSGELTPAMVMKEIIERSVRDADMYIWITPPSLALLQPYIDDLAKTSPDDLPLWGIPFAIKDNIDLAGVATTAACPDFAYEPHESAVVVQRLIEAGAIPVGKTNLDQFATGLVGTRSPYGETHNALRPELISGGSSSGSAVSVARGHAAFALGTDTAGSGRVPAALNDLVGFKPSLGAWPTKGVVPACASLDCVTVFTHDLHDALAVDVVVRGVDSSDPWSKSIPAPRVDELPKAIYVPEESPAFFGPYAAQYEAAWGKALIAVKSLNIPVIPLGMDMLAQAAEILYGGPWVAERWADLGEFVTAHPGSTFPVTEQVLRTGSSSHHTAASLFQAIHKLQEFKLIAGKQLADAVLMLPTCGGTWSREEVRLNPITTNSELGRYTNHCNLLDLCAVAVQAGAALPDIPFGVTFFAAAQNESLICSTAEAFVSASHGRQGLVDVGEGSLSTQVASKNQLDLPNANDAREKASSPDDPATIPVAVCGLHMRGFPLEKQMLACGAVFDREAISAPKYRFVKLPTVPAKPGMIKQEQGGAAIALEIWRMPLHAFGGFAASIPAPLGIGKVELSDGSEVPGFICEGYAAAGSEDISGAGSWRNVVLT